MSQFEANPYGSDMGVSNEPPRTSALAISALICSLLFCIPIAPLGVLLGIIALVAIGGKPHLKGRGLALTAIVIGLIVSIAWGMVIYYGGRFVRQSIEFVMEGPGPALAAGSSGDLTGFRAQFTGSGATASDEEVRAFLDEMESRYGAYVSSRFNENSQQAQPQPGNPVVTMPYVLTFANGSQDADAELVFADQQTGQMLFKLGWVLIKDDANGDLRFPALPPPPTGASDGDGS